MKTILRIIIVLAGISLLGSCQPKTKEVQKPDILRADMDTTVDPGKDFYRYANGTWLKNNPIPATESRWGIGNLVKDEIYEQLKKISEDAANTRDAPKNSTTQRIGDLYASAMDSVAIEKAGVDPLKPELSEIDEIIDKQGLVDMMALLQAYNAGTGFGMSVSQDEKNSAIEDLHFSQGGLGMPNREYYLNNDARTKNIREQYVKYMAKTLDACDARPGSGNAEAADVLALETSLARVSRKLEDLRNPYANYHKMAVADFDKITPSINWENFFVKANIPKQDSVVLGQPEFFSGLEIAISTVPLQTWKSYLRWQLVNGYSERLSKKFDQASFNFYSTVLSGATQMKPRWKRVIDYENQGIGELLGQSFVKEYFPPETKQRYVKLVDAILAAYKNHIQNVTWMSDSTKARAINKLASVTKKIGYPDKWKDFTGMDIERQSYCRNVINIDHFWYAYTIKKLSKPVDRTEWDMNPQEYNAYYNPSNNEIVLPAAAFTVPGYKDSELDDALVYGYAGGSTIGHEITHGFDDQGHLYDEKGNLKNWWTKDDEKKFKERTQKYVDQFNKYVVLDTMHVNGKASLGENLADLGGIVIGLDAFKQTEEYKSGKKIAGLTPLQRYFLGYALGWMVQQRPEKLAEQILTDVHAPADLRVNGPLSNVPEFYQAFGIKKGEPLWREEKDRVVIW